MSVFFFITAAMLLQLLVATPIPFSCIPGDCECSTRTGDRAGDMPAPGNGDRNATARSESVLPHDTCTLYLAPSTIPGAGLGVFTGVERKEGNVIADHDIAIPIPDVWVHLTALGDDILDREDYDYLNVVSDYVWKGADLGMQREAFFSASDTTEYIWSLEPGVNAAINGHLGCGNVDRGVPMFDNENMDRSKDPGTGAFTPYYGTETFAISNVPAGGELFNEYAEYWFVDRTETLGNIPLHSDYDKAEEILHTLYNMFETREIPKSLQKELWEMMHTLPLPKTRVMNAIPRDFEDLELVVESGMKSALQRKASRPVKDLEDHGRCMDNIRPQSSTLEQAGRGAFSTRFLPKDAIITGTPVLFFPSDTFFRMYNGDWYNKINVDTSSAHGYQLLLNYCLKHDESSILLCPYGSGINFVNHNMTRANVRLQWARNGQLNHDEAFLKQSPSAMYYQAAPKLLLDLVAMRDIEPGEELFLDYGAEWEEAWLEHLLTWPHGCDSGYISPRAWNNENRHATLRTEAEQKAEPYPANFHLFCLPEINSDEAETLDSYAAESLWDLDTRGYPCAIVDREKQENGEYYYAVIFTDSEDHHLDSDSKESWSQSDWIVREAMRFEDSPYSTDVFLKRAFRHPIGFPDDIFPDSWRGQVLEPLPPLSSTK